MFNKERAQVGTHTLRWYFMYTSYSFDVFILSFKVISFQSLVSNLAPSPHKRQSSAASRPVFIEFTLALNFLSIFLQGSRSLSTRGWPNNVMLSGVRHLLRGHPGARARGGGEARSQQLPQRAGGPVARLPRGAEQLRLQRAAPRLQRPARALAPRPVAPRRRAPALACTHAHHTSHVKRPHRPIAGGHHTARDVL